MSNVCMNTKQHTRIAKLLFFIIRFVCRGIYRMDSEQFGSLFNPFTTLMSELYLNIAMPIM